jgi:hypothetical protein
MSKKAQKENVQKLDEYIKRVMVVYCSNPADSVIGTLAKLLHPYGMLYDIGEPKTSDMLTLLCFLLYQAEKNLVPQGTSINDEVSDAVVMLERCFAVYEKMNTSARSTT